MMNTKKFSVALLIGLALATACAVKGGDHYPEASKPNILFISVDDLNAWVGHIGKNPQAKTPNIDRLAKMGVSFSRAYSNGAACNPSRTSLMTGKMPGSTGVYSNKQVWTKLVKEGEGLNHHLRKNGYKTFGAGKIYHGYGNSDFESGWDEYPSMPEPPTGGAKKYQGYLEPLPLDLEDEDLGDWHAVNYGIKQLQKTHDAPFFLAIGLSKPHLPWAVPRKYYDMFPIENIKIPAYLENDLDDVPEAGRKAASAPGGDHEKFLANGRWKNAIQSYLATIAYTDMNIGRLLDALENSQYKKNTIIVLWGDHGWHLGEKDHWRKGVLWEEGLRTPLIWVAPGVSKKGVKSEKVVDLLSIYPTLCELAGLAVPGHVEGTSIVSLLQNPKNKQWDYAAITTKRNNHQSVRTARWRYINYGNEGEELYDHENDDNEYVNLANDPKYAAIKAKLKAKLPTNLKRLDKGTMAGKE